MLDGGSDAPLSQFRQVAAPLFVCTESRVWAQSSLPAQPVRFLVIEYPHDGSHITSMTSSPIRTMTSHTSPWFDSY